ncbi:MAG: helix-turn-helix transcriptional regulator [Pirellulales bacterium]
MATSEEHAEFCERVKARRKELGLTQAEMAEKLGITQPSYAYIEAGRREPGLNQMCRLASALETTVHDLLPVLTAPGKRK